MNISSSTSVPVSTETTTANPLTQKQLFEQKAAATVSRVVIELLHTVSQSQAMPWPTFVATHITPKQQALTEMDNRTSQFFANMMNAINPDVDAIPVLNFGLQMFAAVSGDAGIRKKLVEGIALPHVKTMIAELDAVDASIVDTVNAS